MPESVDAFRYLSYLRSRWLFVATSCAIAVTLTFAVSLAIPKKYTATARVLVEPPAGTDLRSALAVSPIYLESLKTYEHFASSDSLFLRALDHFHLRQHYPDRPVESLKTGILKVAMVQDTKILEIRVTLRDPKTAQALAQYLAEETVRLNRNLGQEGDQELTEGFAKQANEARARMQQSDAAWSRAVVDQPVDGLQQQIQSDGELKSSLERQLMHAEQDATDGQGADATAARALADTLRKQLAQVEHSLSAAQELMTRRMAERDKLDAQRTSSQASLREIESRLDQARGELGFRGERLRVIDPGIVPEMPTSPNVPLNLFAAFLVGIVAPIIYLTLELSYQVQRGISRRSALRVAGTRDE